MVLHTRYDAPTLSISYDYAHDWLYLDWHGALDGDAVMAGGLQLLKQQYRSKVLDNIERITGLWAAAAKWGSGAMLPLLHEAGCRHLAWVYSPERYS